MADRYEELRAALDDGPTPGPWKANTSGEIGPISREDDQSFGMILPVAFAEFENSEANLRYIAAYHPEAIRALLAERDALREALDLVNDLSSQECQDQNGKRMAATGNDGKRFWFITDDVMRVVRAALAQKQGEEHDNQV